MQKGYLGSYVGTSAPNGARAEWVLEDSDRVELHNNGKHVATLVDPAGVIAGGVDADGLHWLAWRFARLYWMHTSSILMLQGARADQLLPPTAVLVKGQPCAVHDPRPGYDSVVILQVLGNPKGLGPEDLFKRWLEKEG